jgi:hypothetical protein
MKAPPMSGPTDDGCETKNGAEHTKQPGAVLETRDLRHDLYCGDDCSVVSMIPNNRNKEGIQIPAAPTPLTTRPAISWLTFFETPQIKDPVSKMVMVDTRTHLAGKMRIIWP